MTYQQSTDTSCVKTHKPTLNGEPNGVPKGTFSNTRDAYKAWLERQRAKGGGSTLMVGSYQRRLKKSTI